MYSRRLQPPCATAARGRLMRPPCARGRLVHPALSVSNGRSQAGELDASEAAAALRSLAKLHGFFWAGSTFWREGGEEAAEMAAAVWPSGAYWQPSMQPSSQCGRPAA